MPWVVTRWHGLGAQKLVLARLMNEATVWGALAPSSSKVMSPHVVLTVATKVLPAAVALAGTSFCCFGVAWLAGGAVQPAASFCPAARPPDELGHDDDGRDDEDDREDHTEDLLVARRVAHRGLLGLLVLFVAAARTCAFLLFGHEPLLVRASWADPGRSVILWTLHA